MTWLHFKIAIIVLLFEVTIISALTRFLILDAKWRYNDLSVFVLSLGPLAGT